MTFRLSRTLLITVALVCLSSAMNSGVATVQAKETWIAVHSKNFNLIGNASEKEIKQVANRLEQFRVAFSYLLPNLALDSPVPTTVIVFKSDSSYKPFKPVADGKVVDVAGYFQPGRDVNYITITTESHAEDPYRTIFHEYVHLLINNTFGRAVIPPWFNEGLAEYYSTLEVAEDRKVSLGKTISGHLQLLRSTKLLPLKTLFGVDYYSLERNKHDSRSLFYAQSWALVHYLIQGNNGARLPAFEQFFGRLLKNNDVETAFRDVFKMDYTDLEKEMNRYIQQEKYRITIATFQKNLEFESEMTSAPISEAQAQAYLGDLLYHNNRVQDAIGTLSNALVLDPTLPMAHASLGLALMRQKKFDEAKHHLQQALADSSNYLAHYYYAFVLSREGMDENDFVAEYSAATASVMRRELKKAIELKPDFAESYNLLAFVDLVTGDDLDAATSQIKKAIALSPGSEDYLFVLSQIYLKKHDFAGARKVVEPLATTSSDPRIRTRAEGLLQSINSYEAQFARFSAIQRKAPEQTSPTPNQIVVTEGGAAPTASNEQSEMQAALRKPGPDEKRIQGRLTRIDCSPAGILFTISKGAELNKFSAKKFDDVDVTTYTTDVAGELTCGPRKIQESVVVTYKSAKDARGRITNVLVAMEFVPKDFTLSEK